MSTVQRVLTGSSLLRCVLVMALAGCARFEPSPLDLSKTAEQFESRTLDDPGVRGFLETHMGPINPWPPDHWNFEQLSLAAVHFHPSMNIAQAELASSRAAEITAGQRPNPSAGITPEYSLNPAAGVSPWIALVQFDLPLETAGKRARRLSRAAHFSDAAQLRLHKVAWNIRSNVRSALLDLEDARRRAELWQRQRNVAARALASLQTQLEQGGATALAPARAELALERTRQQLASATAATELARANLAAAMGIPLRALPDTTRFHVHLPADSAPTLIGTRRRALTSRIDLLAQLARYAAAEADLELEIARQYPNLHLGPGYEFDQGENKWSLGLSMELPLLNRNQGPIAEAQARRAEVAAQAIELQTQILAQVDRAIAAWNGAQTQWARSRESLRLHQDVLRLLQQQFKAGAIESLPLLNAEAELIEAEQTHSNGTIALLRAFGALEDAIQFPMDYRIPGSESAPVEDRPTQVTTDHPTP